MFTIPVEPEVIDWRTLKGSQENKYNTINRIKNDCSPEKLLRFAGKDSKVKEQQRRFEKRDLSKVEYLQKPEVEAEFGDLVKLERPDITTFPMSCCAVYIHRGRRHADKQCETDEKIVETKVGFAEKVFRTETEKNGNAGDDTENDRNVDENGCLVTDGIIAVGVGHV
jgi:hypothetical protein